MAKLQINSDGTVTVPLSGGQVITLREPTMAEMATVMQIAITADDALPVLPPAPVVKIVDGKIPVEQLPELEAYNAAVKARRDMSFGVESPHGAGFIEIVNMLAMETTPGSAPPVLTPETAFGWMMSPAAMKQVVDHFQNPSPGEE